MSFTELFIRRPVLSMVVSLLILLLGAQGLMSLQVRQYPGSRRNHDHDHHRHTWARARI